MAGAGGRRYGFVKPSLVRLFSAVDGLGERFLAAGPRASAWPEPERILLVNLAHIGDVVLTTPAIAAVADRFPGARLTMLAGPWSADAARLCPRLAEVVPYRASWWDRGRGSRYLVPNELLELVRVMRAGRYDVVLNFKSFFQENLAAALAGVPRRVGHGGYGGGFLHTDLVPFAPGRHTVLQHLSLAEAIGARADGPRLELRPSADDADAAAAFLGTERLAGAAPLVALHAGAGYPSKLWPLERWAELARALRERHGAALVLLGGPGDAAACERIRAEAGDPVSVAAGRLSLGAGAALLGRCAAFAGNDSAPAHLAAAMGTPAVVVFSGESDADVWRPWGGRVVAIQKRPECAGCGLQVCDRDHRCMTAIGVDEVLDALSAVLAPDRLASRPAPAGGAGTP